MSEVKEIVIASWSKRFLAWLIDFIIVNIVIGAVIASFGTFALMLPRFFNYTVFFTDWSIRSIAFFAYWTLLEAHGGQSIGKMALSIKVTDLEGKEIDLFKSAIQSFGKAFLLPIDIIIGLVAFGDKRQRAFNRISETIVIKVKPKEEATGIKYVKETD
jgi:uncharacterized RDD family membrane protein YckC